MAFEYLLVADCRLHASQTPEEVMQLSKHRERLIFIRENEQELRKRNKIKKIEDFPVVMVRNGQQTKTTVSVLIRMWLSGSGMVKDRCPVCPINFRKRLVGCYGALNYPISAQLEEWWKSHFRLNREYGSSILSIIDEFELDGKRVDQARPNSSEETFMLQANSPKHIKLEPLDREITTSQIIEVLWLVTSPPRDLLWSFLYDFGAVQGTPETLHIISSLLSVPVLGINLDGGIVHFISEEIREGLFRSGRLPLSPEEEVTLHSALNDTQFVLESDEREDCSVSSFKRFLYACWIALKANCPIHFSG